MTGVSSIPSCRDICSSSSSSRSGLSGVSCDWRRRSSRSRGALCWCFLLDFRIIELFNAEPDLMLSEMEEDELAALGAVSMRDLERSLFCF